ncbi:teichoic acid ABC transporter permease [Paenibacillus selenitireducens]|uniref:Transport permease protein n=1 Tax=Paenibacillus selenitireducens TaxID=1324314 RepID=A0A1T2X911_9BACL|nr:ABC transporter permease [Paenibacillus selenitireducens]OPA76083.1 teichoic acid ABC transporter permease [Paenibacillus selenitireducens]
MRLFKELYHNKGTIFSFAKNDFKNRYAGSYLGIAWAFIQPLMQILIFWFVFQVGFRTTPVEDVPYIVWFICGMIPWFFLSEAIMGGTMSIVDYTYIVKKVVFNIKILPLIKVLVSSFVHLFFVVLLFVICALVNMSFTLHAVQIIYYSICIFVLALGLSYLTSSLVPFSKDVGQVVSIVLNFGFWLTPIVWNQNILSPTLLTIFKFNPAYYIVQGYRDALVYKVWFWERPLSTLYFWVAVIIIFFLGKFIFKRLKPHFADVL